MEADRGAVKRGLFPELAAILAVLSVVTIMLALLDADITVSSRFHIDGRWPIGELFPWKFLYWLDRKPAILIASVGLAAALIGFFKKRMRSFLGPGLFLVLLLAIGPGLFVNAIFKDHWGRPRPREIQQFGGTRQFQQPWQPGIRGKGRSFPSGHSSAAFYLCSPYFIFRRTRPTIAKLWLAGGIVFGIAMSYARIAQGGHFLTDTLWSFGMVWLVAVILARLLIDKQQPEITGATRITQSGFW